MSGAPDSNKPPPSKTSETKNSDTNGLSTNTAVQIFVAAALGLFCVMLYLRRPSAYENKPAVEDDDEKEREPQPNVPEISDIAAIYTENSLGSQRRRYSQIAEKFQEEFKTKPDFYVRSPGRVNIIGEHIDYCGYSVFPMAVEKDIVFAVSVTNDGTVHLANSEPQFESCMIDLNDPDQLKIDTTAKIWYNYFLAAYCGVREENGSRFRPKGLRIFVNGNLPKGSGLSSSSAFVCGAAVSLLYANNLPLIRSDIAKFCIRCERYVGVLSGGMDQTICLMAEKNFAKHVEFVPELKATSVRLPKGVVWAVTNSLSEHTLMDESGTRNYNTRVVECRLATMLLGKALGLATWKEVSTLRELQDTIHSKMDDLVFQCLNVLQNAPYTIDDVEHELGCKAEECMHGLSRGPAMVEKLRQMNAKLEIQKRAIHVYSEARRVLRFRQVCEESPDDVVEQLGRLMNESHKSCHENYDCSCEELEMLRAACLSGGAVGSRLTGAGWGGCVISLVREDDLDRFQATVKKEFYATVQNVPLDAMFTTVPSNPLTLVLS